MSDDSDLVRLFAEDREPAGGAAFAQGVLARIRTRRRIALLVPAALSLSLLLAAAVAAPALADTGTSLSTTALQMANDVTAFFNSPAGTTLAAALTASALGWAWLYPRLAPRR